jgi:hypothetical protein
MIEGERESLKGGDEYEKDSWKRNTPKIKKEK